MTRVLRAGVVGCGNVAGNHAAAYRGLAPFHALQIADFTAAVREGREPAVTGREAAKSLAILTALYRSAASGLPEAVPQLTKETSA